jgi:Protein of unknown function (DUF4230)
MQDQPKRSPSFMPVSVLKNLLLIASGSMAVIVIIFLARMGQTGSRLLTEIGSFFHISSATPQVDIPTLIVQQVRGVSELTTTVFVMETVVPTSEDLKMGELVLATTKLLYIAHGEVRAGVDLSQLKPENVTVKNNIISIQLPPPKILDSKIDVNRSQVYDYNRGFLGLGPDVAPELQTLAERKTLETIVTTACNQGILEEANTRAKLTISQLLTTTGYTQVAVKTSTPSLQVCYPK